MSGPARSSFCSLFQGQYNDHDSVLGQMLTVTQYDISYITNAKSVYHDGSCMDFLLLLRRPHPAPEHFRKKG